LFLIACSGDDGRDGVDGQQGQQGQFVNGADGSDGLSSLIRQANLQAANAQCFSGGVMVESGRDTDADASYIYAPTLLNEAKHFNRIAVFPVFFQDYTNANDETTAEIITASTNSMALIYTESPADRIGFVDISDPSKPSVLGVLGLSGEPTEVAVKDEFALVGMNASADIY
jgi:hypothetical protein